MKMLEKLQKRLQEGKKNNKGFSLVELIIVIAIMAILIGIVGMNVIPQIENARKAKDLQVLSAYVTEAMEAYTQNVASLDSAATYTITINVSDAKATVSTATNSNVVETSFQALSGLDGTGTLKFESTAGGKLTKIVIECKNSSPMITLTCYTSDTAVSTDFEVLKSNE